MLAYGSVEQLWRGENGAKGGVGEEGQVICHQLRYLTIEMGLLFKALFCSQLPAWHVQSPVKQVDRMSRARSGVDQTAAEAGRGQGYLSGRAPLDARARAALSGVYGPVGQQGSTDGRPTAEPDKGLGRWMNRADDKTHNGLCDKSRDFRPPGKPIAACCVSKPFPVQQP